MMMITEVDAQPPARPVLAPAIGTAPAALSTGNPNAWAMTGQGIGAE